MSASLCVTNHSIVIEFIENAHSLFDVWSDMMDKGPSAHKGHIASSYARGGKSRARLLASVVHGARISVSSVRIRRALITAKTHSSVAKARSAAR